MQQSCSCRDRNVFCLDTKFDASSSLYAYAFGNCRDIIFFVAISIFVFSMSTLLQQSFSVVATHLSRLISVLIHFLS